MSSIRLKTKKQFLNSMNYDVREYIANKDVKIKKRRNIIKSMRIKKQRAKYKGLMS